jgi:uncharacterized protein YdeI (YjbR/CyaY-like superfamily)
MIDKKVATGVAHEVPKDMRSALLVDNSVLEKWENLTPLARNEWICWVITTKKLETRQNHIERTISELREGKRRPCCWMGCTHRTDKPINATQKWILEKQSKQ